jgi:hypothetical protein
MSNVLLKWHNILSIKVIKWICTSLRVLPRGDIIVDRATEFSEDSRLIIEDASQVPGVERILRKRCRAHIRSLGAIKIQKTNEN